MAPGAELCHGKRMRLRIATAFALLMFAALSLVLVKVSRVMPKPTAQEETVFAFNPDKVSGEKAFAILEELLAISPRQSGSKGAMRAATLISERLTAAGVAAEIDEFEDATPEGKITFRNVTATIPGDGKSCIVLISHYDTKDGISRKFTGANDSGSSTALLIQLADVLASSTNTAPDIVLAFVDGEECMKQYSPSDGLHGSTRLAHALARKYGADNIHAAIVLDMIGDSDLSVTIPKNSSPQIIEKLFEVARAEGKRQLFSLYSPMLDDHAPFLEKGIPAIDIIDFHYGSSPRANDYWHTEKDSIDKISSASLETIGRITVLLLNSLIADPLD